MDDPLAALNKWVIRKINGAWVTDPPIVLKQRAVQFGTWQAALKHANYNIHLNHRSTR